MTLKLLCWLAGAFLLAWLIGRILTDRHLWTQWLFWIPTPAAVLAAFIGLLATSGQSNSRRQGKVQRWAWFITFLAVAVDFVAVEHRFVHRAPPRPDSASSLRIGHWNMGPATWRDLDPFFNAMKPIVGDVTIITNPGGTHAEKAAQEWIAGQGLKFISFGPFAMLTRLGVSSVRTLVATQGMWVVLVEIDATSRLGRPIQMYVVDFPSNARMSRMAMARQVRAMLDSVDRNFGGKLPQPDLVVGDFNIPRGSASLDLMFPGLREAYDEAGHGYGATFHRAFPLYHIDHMRLGPRLRAIRYDLMDLGVGRHKAQVLWLRSQ